MITHSEISVESSSDFFAFSKLLLLHIAVMLTYRDNLWINQPWIKDFYHFELKRSEVIAAVFPNDK